MRSSYTLGEVLLLASIIVHFDEYNSKDGHPTDLNTARSTISQNPIAADLMAELDSAGLLPLRRDGVNYRRAPIETAAPIDKDVSDASSL